MLLFVRPAPIKKSGMILVLALLWLAVITTLVIIGIQVSIMQTRMTANYQEKIQAFALAESALMDASHVLTESGTSGSGGTSDHFYQYQIFSDKLCGSQLCYEVQAIGLFHKAKSVLQAIYLMEKTIQQNETTKYEARLMSWEEIL